MVSKLPLVLRLASGLLIEVRHDNSKGYSYSISNSQEYLGLLKNCSAARPV